MYLPISKNMRILLMISGPSKRTPYRVLLLDTKYEDEAEYAFADENWYLMLGFSAKFNYIGNYHIYQPICK